MNPFAPIKENRDTQYFNFISHLWEIFVNEPEKMTKAGSKELLKAIAKHGFERVKPAKR